MKCPICKTNPAILLLNNWQECEDCRLRGKAHTTADKKAIPVPTGLIGLSLVEWCQANPGYRLKMSDVRGDEAHTCRAIVGSKIVQDGTSACYSIYWYSILGGWEASARTWVIHSECQCYGIWTESEQSPLWRVGR